MKIIGITGPTGAGKTTALRALEELGVCILDADAVYHELLARSPELKKQLRERFGSGILNEAGEVELKKLGSLVFGDPAALKDLNAIAHAHVLVEMSRRTEAARLANYPAVAIDAIALIESGVGNTCDTVVSVLAPAQVRIARIMARDGIDRAYAQQRVAAQQTDEFYRANSQYVLENLESEGPEEFRQKARSLFEQILHLEGGATHGRKDIC